jgi:hypothetical protein
VAPKADVAVLRALLGACRLQPNLEIGEWMGWKMSLWTGP